MTSQYQFTVTAARGMLALLNAELKQLGIQKAKTEAGSVRFSATLEDAYKICLWSRIAVRVLLPIANFKAETPEQLYEGIIALPWEQHVDGPDRTIAVDFNSFRSRIKHSHYGAQRVKDGIVDRFRRQTGNRPSVKLYQPDVRINVYLKYNQATVSIDLSGESLHQRGYRVAHTSAPLKENLAAAILLCADWPKLASQGWGLIDPMCGSGTFLIEAAMIAADIAPGLLRDYYGFSNWKQHDRELWEQLKANAKRRRQAGLTKLFVITGGDIDSCALEAAQQNIHAAGLADCINVHHRQLIDWQTHRDELPENGLFVCNPPYGKRIGDADRLPDLYEDFGDVIHHGFAGWRSALISNNADLGKLTGLTLYEQKPFDNGPIACEALFYRAPRPVKQTDPTRQTDKMTANPWQQAGIVSRPVASEQAEIFANRLKKNLRHLSKWARKNEISCYRVYDADLPDFALAIDLYADRVHVQEYVPAKSIDPQKAVERLEQAIQIIPQVLALPASNLVLKLRQRQRGKQQYEAQSGRNQRFQVTENGLKFWVNLTGYLDTGLFLDHRDIRLWLLQKAHGKDFLNLFCYTGSATVYAAAGGARGTTSVDMSNTYLGWAQDNMALNGFSTEAHQFVRANCIEWLQTASKQMQRYDLIFLDPPTFSNSSRMEGVLDIQRDHVWLIQTAAGLLTEGGVLIFSTNRRDFKLDTQALTLLQVEDISRQTIPKDFERNTKIHYCWKICPSDLKMHVFSGN